MKFLNNNQVLEIAEADPNDAAAIIDYLKQVGSETDNLSFGEEGISLTVKEEETFLEKRKDLESFNNKLFVGKVDGKIVSVSGVQGSKRKRLNHNVEFSISVLKEFWNLGVGKHMSEHVLNYCRLTKKIHNVTLQVRKDNEYAIKLYKELGFKKVGTLHNVLEVDGTYYDHELYEILL